MRGLLSPLIKLIVFTIVTVLVTGVLVATISNSTDSGAVTYRAQFTDVTGVLPGDDVRVAGVRVGAVEGIKIVDRNLAQLTFSVDKTRPVPTSAIAKIRYLNLVGQRYLDISQGPGTPNQYLPPNGLIPVNHTVNALDLTVLFAGFQPLFQGLPADQINSLSNEIIQVFQGEGGTMQALFQQTADLTTTIANKDQVIGNLINHLNSVLQAVSTRDTELSNLILELQRWVSGLAADRVQIGNSLDGINALTATTAGMLQTIRPPLAKDITDIQALSSNINSQASIYSGVLQRMPTKVAALTRTATYGSWFNFYLCEFNANLTVGTQTFTPNVVTPSSRCQ